MANAAVKRERKIDSNIIHKRLLRGTHLKWSTSLPCSPRRALRAASPAAPALPVCRRQAGPPGRRAAAGPWAGVAAASGRRPATRYPLLAGRDPAPTYASKIVIQSIHTHISRRDEVICMTRAYFV